MFLKRLDEIRTQTWLRLTFWYAALFSLSALLVAVMVYGFIYRSVNNSYEKLIDDKVQHYRTIADSKDQQYLIDALQQDALSNALKGFYLLLSDADGNVLALNAPDEKHLNDNENSKKNRPFHDDDFIGRTLTFHDKSTLIIGFLHYEAFDFLEDFTSVLLTALFPIICLGLGGGAFLSYKALKPVQDFVKAIDGIDQGEMGVRVPERSSNSELDILARRFNAMLDQIEILVTGLKGTLNNVAHDIRTPLARMRAVIEQRIQDDNPESMREALMDCAEDINRVSEMVNMLMDVTQIETGVMALDCKEFKLRTLIDEVLSVYDFLAEEKKIEIINNVASNIICYGDRNRLMQVFANLVDNGLKYSNSNSMVTISATQGEAEVECSVSDTGIGIEEQYHEHIFDRLYRVDKSRGREGYGLGLSIVKATIEAHKGQITVTSQREHGSTFTIKLPLNTPFLS